MSPRLSNTPYKQSCEEVQLLDLWRTDEDLECKRQIEEIERGYQLKQSHQDVVEKQLLQRKQKLTLPSVKSKPSTELQQLITERRLEARKLTIGFKEKGRFSKAYEDELEQTRLKYQSELEATTLRRGQLRKEVSEERKHLADIAIELETAKLRQDEANKRLRSANDISMTELFFRRSTLEHDIERMAELYETLKEALQNKLVESARELREWDQRVHQCNENLKLIKRTQIKHFKRQLSEGLDTRDQGLEWIVKALWALGCKVKPKSFPAFLDADAVTKIMEFAALSCEYDRLHKQLDQSVVSSSRQIAFDRDRWNGLKTKLKRIQSNLTIKRKKLRRWTRDTDDAWEEVEEAPPLKYQEGEIETKVTLDKQILALRRKINDLKDKEIERLTHVCYMNNYETKHGVEMKQLLACVVGIDSIDRFLASINRERKTLSVQKQYAKTFKFCKVYGE
jgi:hypothetical protein